jgi:hypothetical protein
MKGAFLIKPKKGTQVETIFVILTEEENDYYFKPEGVLFIDDLGHHTLYCSDVRYNFLRQVIQKFPYSSLEEGISFRDHQVKIQDITASMAEKFGTDLSVMTQVLQELYDRSPRHFDFLANVLRACKTGNI